MFEEWRPLVKWNFGENESGNINSLLARHCKKISEHKIRSTMIINLK